jgi:hypothetical protein
MRRMEDKDAGVRSRSEKTRVSSMVETQKPKKRFTFVSHRSHPEWMRSIKKANVAIRATVWLT